MRRRDNHDKVGRGGKALQPAERREDREHAVRDETVGETGGAVALLPVFLFPTELVFYSEQRSSHRRVLTLYNPYSFSISFKMLCTAPSLYRVVEAEGSVRAKSCIDLVVRHLDVSLQNLGRKDQFRMEVRGGGQVGVREIWAELKGGDEGGEEEDEEEKRRKQGGKREKRRIERHQRALSALSPLLVPTQTRLQLPTCTAVRSVSQGVLCVLLALLCVTVLMLPLQTERSSLVPRWLHVSTNQKLACAYTLGLLTVMFLR
ncbi:motile sperm domain-containing protein 1-like [Betta splendens]|uniref:Motile sperm domain-containing protein 1-like n=1 Tax=Betta splendens TaxID=158456 RepID=A0A6P7KMU1_BETSP|nr:motile sperm domain-containing protein 1-like [Betta splendens]